MKNTGESVDKKIECLSRKDLVCRRVFGENHLIIVKIGSETRKGKQKIDNKQAIQRTGPTIGSVELLSKSMRE